MRGPMISPAAICLRQAKRTGMSPPMSRTPVRPLAMKSGRMMSRPPGNQSPKAECTCMSHKPGMRNWPRPSMTRVFFASGTTAECETNVMRSPLITTMESGCTEDVAGVVEGMWAVTIFLFVGFFFCSGCGKGGGGEKKKGGKEGEGGGGGGERLGGGYHEGGGGG